MEWIEIEKRKPIALESGNWDGLRSRFVLVYTSTQQFHVARAYEGILDGSEFFDFYDNYDIEVVSVTHWTELTSPLLP